MAKRQVMIWDANVHEDILISLFQHIKPSSDDWSNVMSDLQGKGYSFTESALRYEVSLSFVFLFLLVAYLQSCFLFFCLHLLPPAFSFHNTSSFLIYLRTSFITYLTLSIAHHLH